jgi:hypothetical protein
VIYEVAASVIAPGMKAGAPSYELELWLATSMLGVTFPVIVVFCDAFEFWPLRRAAKSRPPRSESPGSRPPGTRPPQSTD